MKSIATCLLFCGALAVLIGCQRNRSVAPTTEDQVSKTFILPAVPNNLGNLSDRISFMVTHYWDRLNTKDTAYYTNNRALEQAVVNYFDLLGKIPPALADSSLKHLLAKAEIAPQPKVYAYFKEAMTKYLHDPNSPLRNDNLYRPVARYISGDSSSDTAEKLRASEALAMMNKNKVGDIATNFTFETSNGKKDRLKAIHTSFLLLMFYNPDCHACKETTAAMKRSPVLNSLIEKNKLKILAVFPDEDRGAWINHQKEIPATWINSIDPSQELRRNDLYDLRAIPSLYLLDNEKKIILKDAGLSVVEDWLTQH